MKTATFKIKEGEIIPVLALATKHRVVVLEVPDQRKRPMRLVVKRTSLKYRDFLQSLQSMRSSRSRQTG